MDENTSIKGNHPKKESKPRARSWCQTLFVVERSSRSENKSKNNKCSQIK
jgi:hypothetical protein